MEVGRGDFVRSKGSNDNQKMGGIGTSTDYLGGGCKYFLFSSLFGEMIQFDKHIFQMG